MLQKRPALRQRARKALLLLSFLAFPITMNYLSPYVIIDGASQGIVNGSLAAFGLMFLSALLFGRLFGSGGATGLLLNWRHSSDYHAPDFAGYRVERAPLLVRVVLDLAPALRAGARAPVGVVIRGHGVIADEDVVELRPLALVLLHDVPEEGRGVVDIGRVVCADFASGAFPAFDQVELGIHGQVHIRILQYPQISAWRQD